MGCGSEGHPSPDDSSETQFRSVYHKAKNEIHTAEQRHPGKVWCALHTLRFLYKLPLLMSAVQQTLKVGGLMWSKEEFTYFCKIKCV